jgi:thioredoxin 1
MNTYTGVLVGVVALALVGGGVYLSQNKGDTAMIKKEAMEETMMKDVVMDDKMLEDKAMDGNMMDDQAVMDKEVMGDKDAMMKKDAMAQPDAMVKVGSYEAYSPEKIARAESGDVVLFFHASWCPSCRSLSADIEKNLATIPVGVNILKVDYDTANELKKKYGVTYQHTLVQVNKDGDALKKWSGSPRLSDLLSQIQ